MMAMRQERRHPSLPARRVEPEVLLVHPGGPFWANKDLGALVDPKGGTRPRRGTDGSRPARAAEELGAPPELVAEELLDLGSVRQRTKIVHGWAAEADFDPAELCSATLHNGVATALRRRAGVPRGRPGGVVRPAVAREKLIPAQAAFVERLLEHLD